MSFIEDVFKIINSGPGRMWKIDGRHAQPTQDDVGRLLAAMVKDVRTQGYDLIESGGILVKRDGSKTDVYVHVGVLNETDSI